MGVANPIVPAPTGAPTPGPAAAPTAPAPSALPVAPAPTAAPSAAPPVPAADPAAPAAPAAPALKLAPTDVPYPRFRETEVELTKTRRELAALKAEHEPVSARATTLEKQIADTTAQLEESRLAREDRDHFLRVLDANPALKTEFMQALHEGRIAPADAAALRARPGAVPAKATDPALSPELTSKIETLVGVVERAARVEEQAQTMRVQAEFDTKVAQQTQQYLLERDFDPNQVIDPIRNTKLIDVVLDYVYEAGDKVGGGKMSDLNHFLNQWYAVTESLVQSRLQKYGAARVQDSALPPSAPGGAPPIHGTEKPPAIGEPRFNSRVIDAMKRLLGQAA